MSNIEQAIQSALNTICELHQQNKNISVASVKNHNPLPLPLPAITRAITAFKENPQSYLDTWQENHQSDTVVEIPPVNNTNKALEQRVSQLEQQVAELQKVLAQLQNKAS
ncbi:hypothetical protein DS2_02058 [Catenovulum agarivorans DS-2]|uniref:Uncharacterized protein n=1 Tax=Catenovulum agarivorans DS-2 TaxID=1328313 RepID=W7QG62_9ALTE|nr:hypothetical protein [Catenovulum agarivorans]EWH11929.1 hypothetical protein DS2_02058 [Catenovulum agarivorans DS-2]